ncbi:MAG: hypothetical protein K0Q73_8834 [Paenibacillus sp.]|jgi:hypothetical protein|nr:hypothetical protein [Paenibacillus sp.]
MQVKTSDKWQGEYGIPFFTLHLCVSNCDNRSGVADTTIDLPIDTISKKRAFLGNGLRPGFSLASTKKYCPSQRSGHRSSNSGQLQVVIAQQTSFLFVS